MISRPVDSIILGGIKAKGPLFAVNTFVESLVLFNVPDLFKEENQDMHERRLM